MSEELQLQLRELRLLLDELRTQLARLVGHVALHDTRLDAHEARLIAIEAQQRWVVGAIEGLLRSAEASTAAIGDLQATVLEMRNQLSAKMDILLKKLG